MRLLEIVGSRITLAILTPDDADLVRDFVIENRDHLAPWEPLRPEAAFELPAIQERLAKSASDFQAGTAFIFAVLENSTGKMIGTCNFNNIVHGVFQACHLGYAIAESHQGKGYMSEAVTLGIEYMFDTAGLHRVMANYMPRNERSGKLLETLGFEREGYAKSYLKIAGVWEDHILTAKINPNHR
jgi:[ribosomal protein S5]-alanine N-acetyltransferase